MDENYRVPLDTFTPDAEGHDDSEESKALKVAKKALREAEKALRKEKKGKKKREGKVKEYKKTIRKLERMIAELTSDLRIEKELGPMKQKLVEAEMRSRFLLALLQREGLSLNALPESLDEIVSEVDK